MKTHITKDWFKVGFGLSLGILYGMGIYKATGALYNSIMKAPKVKKWMYDSSTEYTKGLVDNVYKIINH